MASLEDRVKKDPKLLARVLKNPGLRSKLPAKYLTAAQRAQRAQNARSKAPVVSGSTLSEGALAREAKAAMDVRYGPREQQEKQALGEEKARSRDTAGFYDQYLAQVAQHARNVQSIGGTAAQTGLGLQQGITGLAGASLTGLQNPATASASARGAQAGDLSGMASSAAAIRQALVGSFVAQQAGQTAAASNYADTQANVVAPGQKLGAQAMSQGRVRKANENITATANERGAANYSFRADRRTEEAKNVLAGQIAGVNAADKLADNATANARVTETTRHNEAAETEAAKKRRAAVRNAAAKETAAGQVPNKYGVPQAEWNSYSTERRQRIMNTFNKTKSGDPKGKGPKWLTPNQSGAGLSQLATIRDAAKRAKNGLKFAPTGKEKGPDPNARLTREKAREKILAYAPIAKKLKHPALVDAAVDAAYDGYLRDTTVRALITAGFKPSEVASTLGVQTSGQVKASDPKPGRPG